MKIIVTWRGFIVSLEWSLLPLHLLSSFFIPRLLLLYKAALYFFYLLIDRLWNATLALVTVKSHRKPIENADWTTSPMVERGKYYEKKRISISCHHIVSWINCGTRGAFNRVEKYFRESDNCKIRFHFIIFFFDINWD